MKTILHVLSMAFSGSTLLDALMDSQPGVASLGEVAQLWEDKLPGIRRGPCHLCGTDARECSFWCDLGAENPYAYAAEKTGADVLVDTSKNPARLTLRPAGFAVKSVVLVKAPHEWTASVRAHDVMKGRPPTPVLDCFIHWENLAGELLHHVRDTGGFLIRYADLCWRTEQVLADLCLFAGVQFDPSPHRALTFWQRRSHALGGNSAVIDQEHNRQVEMDRPRAEWLGGKYLPDTRWRKIRYDDAWHADGVLRRACRHHYLAATPRLRSFLNRLGLGAPEQLADQSIA